MRMSRLSESRQPCRAFSCIDVTRKRPSGRKRRVEMRALPIEQFGRRIGIGKPERRAIIMSDGETVAFRREGEAAHGGRRGKSLQPAVRIAGEDLLGAGPSERAILARGERIDPFAIFAEDFLVRPVGGERDDAPVIAAGQKPFAGRCGDEDRTVGMQRDAVFALVPDPHDCPVAERKHADRAKKGRGG